MLWMMFMFVSDVSLVVVVCGSVAGSERVLWWVVCEGMDVVADHGYLVEEAGDKVFV